MTNEELFDIIGEIDDEYIAALQAPKRAKPWLKWGALAACLCLVTAAAVFIRVFFVHPHHRQGLPLNTTTDEEILGGYPIIRPMLMLGGQLYINCGFLSDNEPAPTDFDGITTGTEMSPESENTSSYPLPPTEDGQANFGSGYSYKIREDNTVLVYLDGRWTIFAPIDEDDEDDIERLTESEMFDSILGFDNCEVIRIEETGYRFYTWHFHAETDGEIRCVAEMFGRFDSNMPEAYSVDLDGDGVDELICNNTSGDGWRTVTVFRNNNGVIETGYISSDYYDELGMLNFGLSSFVEYYDPDQGFVIRYVTEIPEEGEPDWKVATFKSGLENFAFYPSDPTDEN